MNTLKRVSGNSVGYRLKFSGEKNLKNLIIIEFLKIKPDGYFFLTVILYLIYFKLLP